MDQEGKADFIPHLPSDRVRRFVNENPNAGWDGCLQFVLDNFPQVENGAIQWLVEGGVAVHFLRPSRTIPEDIDIITRSKKMVREFVNASPKLDVKTVEDWFRFRLLGHNQESEEFLFRNNTAVPFRNGKIYVLNPVALAASKTIPWGRSHVKRARDIEDIRILSVPEENVQEFIDQLKRNL